MFGGDLIGSLPFTSCKHCCFLGGGIGRCPSVSSLTWSHLHHVGWDGTTLSTMWKPYRPVLVLSFPKGFSSLFFSGSFQWGPCVEEVEHLTLILFYPGFCKRHLLKFVVLWEYILYAINLLKNSPCLCGRG